MTTSHDIAVQILTWFFSSREESKRFRGPRSLHIGSGADDVADAYHCIPNACSQLGLCVVAICNPYLHRMEFYISYAHLFGLTAAVVNFNRLPELLTAAARRIGLAPTWHFFDDQGVLDIWDVPLLPPASLAEQDKPQGRTYTSVLDIPDKKKSNREITAVIPKEGLSAQAFTSSLYHLVGGFPRIKSTFAHHPNRDTFLPLERPRRFLRRMDFTKPQRREVR